VFTANRRVSFFDQEWYQRQGGDTVEPPPPKQTRRPDPIIKTIER